MILTIGVVLYNEEKHQSILRWNLERLLKHSDCVRILCVDNGSTDSTLQMLNALKSEFELEIISRKSNHLGEARQDVVQRSLTPWVGFIDGDCLIPPDWASKLIAKIRNVPSHVAALGGPWKPQGGYRCVYSDLFSGPMGNFSLPQLLLEQNDKTVSHIPTANVAYRRDVVDSVGGFRSFFNRVGEDLDLSVRLQKSGHSLIMCQELEIEHFLPESFRFWVTKIFIYGYGRMHVAQKNRSFLNRVILLPFLFLVGITISSWLWGLWPLAVYCSSVLLYSFVISVESSGWQLALFIIGTHFSYPLGMTFRIVQSVFPYVAKQKQFYPLTGKPLVMEKI
jgi:GT2 family glycosyltransferase